MEWFTWTPLELAANVMTAVCIFLAGRNNVHTWWTGIVACGLFGWLFYTSQLYADVTLQVFFIATSFIGWWNWANKNIPMDVSTAGDGSELQDKIESMKVAYAGWSTVVTMAGIAIVVAAGYGWMLHKYTNAYAPWIDSTVLTFSVIAQLLLMRRNVENWPLWVLVNTLSVPLYWSRGLYMTSALYAVFWVNALWSWKTWVNLAKK
jgi:nicotinamide mononucleotide transporter